MKRSRQPLREAARLWQKNMRPEQREARKEAKRQRYNTVEGRAASMLGGARLRARTRGAPCTLTRDEAVALLSAVWPGNCPCCRKTFDRDDAQDTSPYLDCFDPGLGYAPGNVAVICHRCNRIKSDGTGAEHRQLAEYIERYTRENE